MQSTNTYLRIASCGSALSVFMASASVTVVFISVVSHPSPSPDDNQLFQPLLTQFPWLCAMFAASMLVAPMMFLMFIARRNPMSENEAVLARRTNRLFILWSPLLLFTVGLALWGFVHSFRTLCHHSGALSDSLSFGEVGLQLGALAMWVSMISVQFYQRGRLRAALTSADAMSNVK